MKSVFALIAMMAVIAPGMALAADEVTHTKYACEEGKVLEVVYIGDYAVMLQMDELVPLKLTKSASGVRYTPLSKDYTYELWGKSNEMNLSINDGGKEETILSNCKP